SVSYWPLWEFRDASVVHHYTNGSYDKSTLSFFLGDEQTSLEFKSQDAVDAFWRELRRFQQDAIDAEREMNADYYQSNNLFRGVASEPIGEVAALPRKVAAWAAAAGLALCFAASTKNDSLRDTKWYRHDSPTHTTSSLGQRLGDPRRATRDSLDAQLR